MQDFVETKRHVNKATQTYSCDVLKRAKDWVILQYVSSRSWHIANTDLPVGTRTLAYYEVGANWVVWRMLAPSGELLGHLFHICRDITLSENGVDYLDLLLDVWVDHQEKVTLLDEDELDHCVVDEKLTASQASNIQKLAQELLQTYSKWIARLNAQLVGSA